jgi:hypothetical protein
LDHFRYILGVAELHLAKQDIEEERSHEMICRVLFKLVG